MLSELAKSCADSLQKAGAELIFPAPESDLTKDGVLNVSNIILVRCKDPSTLARNSKAEAARRLQEIAATAFEGLDINMDIATAQIDDLLEFYWAAALLEGRAYTTARAEVGALLAARKNSRDFQVVTWSSNAIKSSLDGARESLIPEGCYPPKNANEIIRAGYARDLYENFGVRLGERLCAVGLLKRRGEIPTLNNEAKAFMSSSHMAAQPLLTRMDGLKGSAREELVNNLNTFFRLGKKMGNEVLGRTATYHPLLRHYDARILYSERLAEFLEGTDLDDLQNALKAVLKTVGVSEPSPYYVLLHADGDKIGKALDGCDSKEQHQTFSKVLSGFANKVHDIVADAKDAKGSTVYAGGDDVLAFLPMHTALRCAAALAQTFEDLLKDYGEPNEKPSLSVGLVVAHHLEPLEDVLNLARVAEKAAKNQYGRNALAITIAKRGGANFTIGGHWGEVDTMLKEFIDLHQKDLISDGAAYELRDIAIRLKGFAELQQAEAWRVLSRKRSGHGENELDPTIKARLKECIATQPLEELANRLIAAKEFAKALDMAVKP